ncbi:hypothetical protein LAZ67_15003004 [Cordylochernes scorpioides]|uniref:Uncharacterized protein n=1 Tax=Cordylochernes scorpioides TaxID=51811 RepID=A0ABY6LA75_9ARAC|nr:hypothetical protein LAZ67_15003004 [Cordylochernes scorpioides]
MSYFPNEWKKAEVLVIPKPGKADYGEYKSYRPLCLNSNISKIFEKIINNKIIKHYEENKMFSNRQHGFTKSRSTITALTDIVKTALDHKAKEFTAIITIDISGAFDNAWWPMVLKRIDEDNVNASIVKLFKSYFDNRKIRYRYTSIEVQKTLSKGCPQGGPISPTIWNIIMNDLLCKYTEPNSEIIGYADDITVICWNKNLIELENTIGSIMRKITNWCESSKLRISKEKTKVLPLFNNKKFTITLNNNTIIPVDRVKILGITVKNHRNKNKLDFMPHIDDTITKTTRASGYLLGLTKKAWGLDSKRRIVLYKTLFRNTIIYGSTIWYQFIPKKAKDKLNSLQYKILKHGIQAYNTTSSNCTHIIARTPKLTHFIESNILKINIDYNRFVPAKIIIISNFINQKQQEYYEATNENFKSFFSGPKIPNFIKPNFYNVQFLTGHGDFNSYLFKIGKAESPGCSCGGEEQNPRHLLTDCPLTADLRELNQLPINLQHLVSTKDIYQRFNKFCRIRAFDTVHRYSIIEALREVSCPEELLQLITSYLINRKTSITHRLTSTIKGQFGSTFSSGHKIYKRVVLPALLYGSGVWGKRVYDTNGARKLHSLHDKYAKAIIRGGACTPTIPAISLTGCPPLDISIKAHIEYLKTLKTGHYESRPSPSFLPYPPLRKIIYFTKSLQLNVTTIYTDGSQSSEGVGAGVILPPPLQTIQLKLHQECSAFQAELLAILYATKITMNFPKEHFIIASDCQSALSAICRSWPPRTQLIAEIIYNLHFSPNVQLFWIKGHSGIPGNELADQAAKAAAHSNLPLSFTTLPKSVARGKKEQIALKMWTDLYIQDYSTRNLRRFAATPKLLLQMLRNIKHGSTSTTTLTGHGYIQADLATVSKEDPICPHCQDEDQTVDHLLFTCPTFQYQRFQTATLLGITNICPASLENLPRKKSAWRHLINWTSTGIVYKSKKT